jgi:SsrA-binding protein
MRVYNRKAPASFAIKEKLEAGIVLSGAEVKSVRQGRVDLSGAYGRIIGSEAYLVGAKIFPYQDTRYANYNPSRTRKLLLHKREIIALKSKITQGNFTLVPLSLYIRNNLVKLELGLAQGKKKFEKREDLKKKELKRKTEQELKEIQRLGKMR